jgi:hypothetical protein
MKELHVSNSYQTIQTLYPIVSIYIIICNLIVIINKVRVIHIELNQFNSLIIVT